MRTGRPPYLFGQSITWESFLSDRNILKYTHEQSSFVLLLPLSLQNIWKDLHTFSCLSNLAYRTTRKLSPELYNEIMISILYRVALLSHGDDVIFGVVASGLVVYAGSLFLQRSAMGSSLGRAEDVFRNAWSLYGDTNISAPVMLWLGILSGLVSPRCEEWQWKRINEARLRLGLSTWEETSEVLRSVMWVDFIHDSRGREVFGKAVLMSDMS